MKAMILLAVLLLAGCGGREPEFIPPEAGSLDSAWLDSVWVADSLADSLDALPE